MDSRPADYTALRDVDANCVRVCRQGSGHSEVDATTVVTDSLRTVSELRICWEGANPRLSIWTIEIQYD